MIRNHSLRCATLALSLLLVAAFLALPAPGEAAPSPEETALSSPWFPETVSAGDLHTCGLRIGGTLACRELQPGQRRFRAQLRVADRRHAGLLGC